MDYTRFDKVLDDDELLEIAFKWAKHTGYTTRYLEVISDIFETEGELSDRHRTVLNKLLCSNNVEISEWI